MRAPRAGWLSFDYWHEPPALILPWAAMGLFDTAVRSDARAERADPARSVCAATHCAGESRRERERARSLAPTVNVHVVRGRSEMPLELQNAALRDMPRGGPSTRSTCGHASISIALHGAAVRHPSEDGDADAAAPANPICSSSLCSLGVSRTMCTALPRPRRDGIAGKLDPRTDNDNGRVVSILHVNFWR